MRDRKILLLLVLTILFGFFIVIWYFFRGPAATNPTSDVPTNPFGSASIVTRGGEFITNLFNKATDGTQTTDERTPASERILTEIWNKPSTGNTFVTRDLIIEYASSTTGTSTLKKLPKPIKVTVEYLLFVDRITGFVYGYGASSTIPFQITNTTVPGVYDAYITNNGTKIFMRHLDEATGRIKTISATLPSFVEGGTPRGLGNIKDLSDNIDSFAVSESSNAYAYTVPTFYGSTFYTVDAKGVTTTSYSDLREWYLNYGGEVPYITNKPSAYLEGSTFSLPNKNYSFGGKTGLMTLTNRTGDYTLSSMWTDSGVSTFIFSKKLASTNILNFQTLASKCVWLDTVRFLCGAPSSIIKGENGMPDDWFQGTVSFSDDLYIMDASDGNGGLYRGGDTLLYSLSAENGSPFDMTHLQTSKSLSSLSFVNKQGGGLWMINLKKLIFDR